MGILFVREREGSNLLGQGYIFYLAHGIQLSWGKIFYLVRGIYSICPGVGFGFDQGWAL